MLKKCFLFHCHRDVLQSALGRRLFTLHLALDLAFRLPSLSDQSELNNEQETGELSHHPGQTDKVVRQANTPHVRSLSSAPISGEELDSDQPAKVTDPHICALHGVNNLCFSLSVCPYHSRLCPRPAAGCQPTGLSFPAPEKFSRCMSGQVQSCSEEMCVWKCLFQSYPPPRNATMAVPAIGHACKEKWPGSPLT